MHLVLAYRPTVRIAGDAIFPNSLVGMVSNHSTQFQLKAGVFCRMLFYEIFLIVIAARLMKCTKSNQKLTIYLVNKIFVADIRLL